MKIEPWIRRHPVCSFFALAFGISWGGILVVTATTGFDLLELRPLDTGLIFVFMLLGPSTSGLALTALLDGRAGLRRLLARTTHWRLGLRWYGFALMTMPLLLLAILWPLGVFLDPAYSPRFQWHLFAIGFIAGSFEEVGWTGFATPRLLQRQRLFLAGLWLGLLWALWHVLVDFRQNSSAMGALWLLEFAVLYVGALSAYRVLMTWVYANTLSLLLAVLMHASYTGWLLTLYPATSLEQGLVWQTAFALALWVVVAVVMTGRAGRGSRAFAAASAYA
ncbi:MAG TPA: CPBP family glutamic-type intramembrane protease [Rubrivivax sp.]|nr:CPBP family glutamic-type intramembrane protease [Rubrivivax sp.]